MAYLAKSLRLLEKFHNLKVCLDQVPRLGTLQDETRSYCLCLVTHKILLWSQIPTTRQVSSWT